MMFRNRNQRNIAPEPTDEEITAEFNGIIIDNFAANDRESKHPNEQKALSPSRIKFLTLAVKRFHDEVISRKRSYFYRLNAQDALFIAKKTRQYAKNVAYAQSDAEAHEHKKEYLRAIHPFINDDELLSACCYGCATGIASLLVGASLPIALGIAIGAFAFRLFGKTSSSTVPSPQQTHTGINIRHVAEAKLSSMRNV